ncbi:MAG TPA: hypothetical protein VLS89_00515 [Candidatus Nanopelagicales bacterium]|nr:hypothetical protein [Candidatus Nanopelagicales bacterium]
MAKTFQSYTGPLTIDLTNLGPALVDIAPGGRRGLRKTQQGIDGVLFELSKSIPSRGEEVGIAPKLYQRMLECNEHLDKIRMAREIVDKLAEVLRESDAKYQDEREAIIGQVADAVKSAARRKDSSLLAPFEATVAYNAQVGVRAAKTRRKKAEEAAQKKGSGGRKTRAKRAKAADPAAATSAARQ